MSEVSTGEGSAAAESGSQDLGSGVWLHRVEFFGRVLVIATALAFLGVFVWSMAVRVGYPYELEWMEGAMLRIATRASQGEALYVEPTIDFTMSVYAPLYFWLAGIAQGILGGGFLGPRLVSIGAVLVSLMLILRFGGREGRFAGAAWVGVGFYAATFGIGRAYHDTVHVDSLFVMWLLAAFYVLRFHNRAVSFSSAVSGLLLALAFMTKQSALPALVLVPVAACWLRGVRQGVLVAACAILPTLGFLTILGEMSAGWSNYFLLGQLAGHEFEDNMWRGFWTFDLGRHVPVAFLGATVAVLAALWRRQWSSAPVLGAMAVVLVGIGYGSRLHKGGAENVLYPTYAGLAILGAIGLALAWRNGEKRPGLSALASLLCLIQFWLLAYDPRPFVPTATDTASGRRFVAAIHAIEGEVLVSFHGQLAAFAGKQPVAHPITIADVLRTAGGVGDDADEVRDAYREHLLEVIRGHRFAAIVMEDTVTDPWWRDTVAAYYRVDRPLLDSDPQYRWMEARSVWPAEVWVPRER